MHLEANQENMTTVEYHMVNMMWTSWWVSCLQQLEAGIVVMVFLFDFIVFCTSHFSMWLKREGSRLLTLQSFCGISMQSHWQTIEVNFCKLRKTIGRSNYCSSVILGLFEVSKDVGLQIFWFWVSSKHLGQNILLNCIMNQRTSLILWHERSFKGSWG